MTSLVAAPGWKLTIDGKSSVPLIADTLFLAAPLDYGLRHTLVFCYRPESVQLGLYFVCISWLVAAGIMAYSMPKTRG
jgi:hypothetical protein